MARRGFFSEHKTWEDWLALLLGIIVMVSPWIVGQTGHSNAVANAVIIGFILVLLAGFEMGRLYRWEEFATLLGGLWLMFSPLALGYANTVPLATVHLGLGALVAALGVLELWQDWDYSDDELNERTR